MPSATTQAAEALEASASILARPRRSPMNGADPTAIKKTHAIAVVRTTSRSDRDRANCRANE